MTGRINSSLRVSSFVVNLWYISNALLTSSLNYFFMFTHVLYLDSADDLFSQQPKKSSKKSSTTKKDVIEDVFDNDNDDFLDAISKRSSTSDTPGDKNGPAEIPDDAPVDMVS